MKAGFVITQLVLAAFLTACGSDRALEEQRRSFEGQIGSLQARVSDLETERQDLRETLSTSLEEEYAFVNTRIEELQVQVGALQERREALRRALVAAGIEVAPSETGGQTGGTQEMLELLESALSGGNAQSTGGVTDGAGTGGPLGTGGVD